LASTQADVELAAPSKHLLLTAKGAYLKLEGGNIELGAPGTIEFKASRKEWAGPKSAALELPPLPESDFCLPCFLQAARLGGALVPAGTMRAPQPGSSCSTARSCRASASNPSSTTAIPAVVCTETWEKRQSGFPLGCCRYRLRRKSLAGKCGKAGRTP